MFKYKKTDYENIYIWLETSGEKCFYCDDQENAPIAFEFFPETGRGICIACVAHFEIGNLAVDRHMVSHMQPRFTSMQEARAWFQDQAEKSGAKFIPVEILHLEDEDKLCHVYYFVHDIENYEIGMERMKETVQVTPRFLNSSKIFGSGAFMNSFTRVEIDEDGDIHIVY